MRFTARSLALTSAGALVLVGLSVPAASAATSLAVSTAPTYNAASTTETVTGTAVNAGDTLALNLTNGSTTSTLRTITASANGAWNYTFSAADAQSVPDGTVTVTVAETYCADLFGNPTGPTPCGFFSHAVTTQATKTFLKDTVVPAAPAIAAVPGSGSDGVINASTPATIVASGTGEPGDTVHFTLGSLSANGTVNSSGNWFVSFDASSLADGTYSAHATQADAAGNTSAAASKTVVKDTVAPRTSTTSPVNGTKVGAPATVVFTYHDTLGSTSTVKLTTGATTVNGAVTVSAGTVTFKPTSSLASGSYTAVATVYDVNGNQTVTTISFTVDATAPVITNLASTKTTLTNANTTVTGSLSEAATLTITSSDSTGAKVTQTVSKPAGAFKVSYSEGALDGGTINVSVRAVDGYGNASTTTTTHTRTVPAGTTITLAVPTWSGVGWPITLSGSVHLVKPGAYGTVTLVHTSLSGKQQVLGPVGLSSTGAYSFKYTPTTSGTYYALYNAVTGSGAQSPTYSSQVRYAISASSKSGPAATKAVISGAAHNPKPGTIVTIFKQNATGAWVKLGTAKLDSTLHYQFSVSLPKGTTTIRVTVPASAGYYGNSATIKVTRT